MPGCFFHKLLYNQSLSLASSESGAGHAGQAVRAAQVSGGGKAAGGAQQVVRAPLPRQRPRPEAAGRHVGEGDRRHPAEAARHLEEESIRDGQRRTAQSRQALNPERVGGSTDCIYLRSQRGTLLFVFVFSALRPM